MQNPLILIVDDIPKNLQVLGNILKNEGYETAAATSGKQALATIDKAKPDLILLDIMMPEMDGFEVCTQIKSNPDYKDISIIFLTGKSDADEIVKGFGLGASDYITKPFQKSELLARVKTQLEIKAYRDTIEGQNEQMNRHNANKDRLFSIISHDLRSPFQGLLGLTQLLHDEYDTLEKDEISEYIGMIHQSANKFFNLLENLLQWTIVERGQIEFNPQPIRIRDVVTENIELYDAVSRKKDIRFEIRADESVLMFTDLNALQTVLRNLFSNAIKFSNPGGTITITAAANGHLTELGVIDRGIGMDQENAGNIFEIEHMKSRPGTMNEKGSGLGLLITKSLIERGGGSIRLETAIDKGTAFYFTQPSAEPAADELQSRMHRD
ncbi:MAG: hybrid sensor histidine kinase/response regulator [Balneolaceae bacterium]|nr:MAG: hybrid sensor histidine kinase/response regulator [Balneolaceae bacterium]